MENLSPVLAQRLRELRRKRGLSYSELSKELKDKYDIQISKESLTNYEVSDANHTKAGKNEGMSVKYLRCLADFYQVSTDYLLGISEVPSRDESLQAVCRFTGLSENAIKAINNLYGLKNVLSLFLEHPGLESLLFQINDYAICKCTNFAIKAVQGDLSEDDLRDRIFPCTDISELLDVYRYRLSIGFKDMFEGISEKIVEHWDNADFQNKFQQWLKSSNKKYRNFR